MERSRVGRMFCWIMCLGVLMVLAGVGSIEAQQAPDKAKIDAARAFYKGKSIDYVVPYAPGGGYDGKARMMQPLMEKYLPGTKVLVKNVPGAGSMVGTNQTYVAKPDGLTMAIVSGVGMVANTLGESPVIKFDVTKFTYLGRINAERRYLMGSFSSKIKDFDSLMKANFKVKQALTGPGSGSYAISQIVLRALAFPREEIVGYQNSQQGEMAVIRGEVDIHLSSESGMDLAERKEVRPLFQMSPVNIESLGDAPNLFTKDIDKYKLSEVQLRKIAFARDLMGLGYLVVAPPNLPPERLFVLEEAVQKTIRDPEFLAMGKKSGIMPVIDPLTGQEVLALVKSALNIPPELKAEMKELMHAK